MTTRRKRPKYQLEVPLANQPPRPRLGATIHLVRIHGGGRIATRITAITWHAGGLTLDLEPA